MKRALVAMVCAALTACDGDSGDDGGGGTPPTPMAQCQSNLANLYAALQQYQTAYGVMPYDTGGAFWIKLSMVAPPLVTDPAWYACPVKGVTPPAGSTDYRGPAADANGYAATAPIGADKVGSHGFNAGGHVLLKNGTISLVAEADPLWIQASSQTAP